MEVFVFRKTCAKMTANTQPQYDDKDGMGL